MKKSIKLSVFGFLSFFSLVSITSCNKTSNEEGKYEIKDVDFYQQKDKADRKIALRFYSDTPNVPYVGVKQYFKEFYKTDVVVEQDDYNYKFKRDNAYIKLDAKNNIFSILNVDALGQHPDCKSSNTKTFLKDNGTVNTTIVPRTIDLNTYYINVYKSAGDAYMPFSLLSNIITATNLFTVNYNEKDLYEFDYQGQLPGGKRDDAYYGDAYNAPMKENTKRNKDMIDFSYNLICLLIDNFRGYTSQMRFIDNNVLSLGLNGTLEKYYPSIKNLLLSDDRKEYIAGASLLFIGLGDGGHTGLLSKLQQEMFTPDNPMTNYLSKEDPFVNIVGSTVINSLMKEYVKRKMVSLKKEAFGLDNIKYYYNFISTSKLSYLGFDSFEVNYDGWDKYYKQIDAGQKGEIPSNDTFAYIREKLYTALNDGAETVVIDLSTNGGGDSGALLGVVGLLNGAKATISFNDTVNHFRTDNNSLVDINLDGKYDQKDIEEANKFKNMNIVILTSVCGFSCGNLLPSLLKELGYKTIGQRTGGGSCAIMIGAMPDGLYYVRSSYKCLSDASGHNIDDGVEVDVNLMGEPQLTEMGVVGDYSNFYNIEYVSNVIKQLFAE